MFRPSQIIPGRDVCRGRGCWRTEGWLPELKQKRGRPASAVADGHELAVQSFISLILQIEGQRYKAEVQIEFEGALFEYSFTQ